MGQTYNRDSFCLLLLSSFEFPRKQKQTHIFTKIYRNSPQNNTNTRGKNHSKKQAKKFLTNDITPPNPIQILSKITLTTSQQQVLSKGLSFVPIPKLIPMSQIYFAYNKFKRRLVLRHMFNTKDGTNRKSSHNPFHTYSSWNPPDPENLSLQKYLTDVYTDLSNLQYDRPNTDNLSETEKVALKELDSNPDIVIKPADKGGKIVILDRDAYINEATRQLSNSKFYIELTYNPTLLLLLLA